MTQRQWMQIKIANDIIQKLARSLLHQRETARNIVIESDFIEKMLQEIKKEMK